MAENNRYSTLTDNQLKAVLLNKGDALVSASAGSGKTHVIIERVIRLILEGQTTVDRLLAVTFTKLAASEMKEKLKGALLKEISNGNDNLKWQYDEVNTCDISTIDSFCSKLVKKYFYKLNVDYSFEILDEAKRNSLKSKVIDEVLAKYYENQDKDFLELAFVLTTTKNDRDLRETLSYFMRDSESKLDSNAIFELSQKTHENASSIIDKHLTKDCRLCGEFFENLFLPYLNLFEEDKFKTFINELLVECNLLKNTKSAYEVAKTISVPACPKKPTNKYDDFFYVFKENCYAPFTSFISYVLDVCSGGKEETDLLAKNNIHYITTLQKLVNECLEYYARLKKEENSYDFNDIEKFAYKLLCDEEVLNAVKNDYDFIFIDEYQDVNGIQESIINLLAQNNEFMVGDSKQSIYAFRGCNPNYFISKFNNYNNANTEESNEKHAINLDNNFRSANNVIKSVNNVFSHVFTKDFGGFDYEKSPMIFNENYQNYDGQCALHLYKTLSKKKSEEILEPQVYSVIKHSKQISKSYYNEQVLLIASLIHKARSQTYYSVKEKCYKPIRLSDICILFRYLNETNIKIIQDLNELGIPITAEAKIKLHTYPEIKAMIELIKAILSLNDDIAISTTMSTIYGFTFNELATIRGSEGSDITFFDAVVSFSKKDGDLNAKVKAFLEKFEEIRLLSEYEKADEILYKIIDESGYEARLLASPFGEYKLKRIKRLISESCKTKKLTIKEFNTYLEYAIDEISTCETSGDDACKVMTVHNSKGLEFPYVIFAGTSAKFNYADIEKVKILKSEEYGLCLKNYDKENMLINETPLTRFIKKQAYFNASLEEARVLYVAMTRAMYKLDVIAKDGTLGYGIPFFVKHPNSISEFFIENDMPIVTHDDITQVEYSTSTPIAGSIVEESTILNIVNNFNYVYKYDALTKMPVKVSVSDVSHDKDDDEYFETTSLFGTTTKEMGTAYHKILQLVNFYSTDVESEINLLKEKGEITNEDISLIDINKIKSILKMDIFNTIKDYTLYKEEKFTFFVDPCDLGYNLDKDLTDKVLVQGIIDLMAIKDDKCILIDYKLSSLKNDDDLIKTYKTQLTLYKNAIEKCLKIKVEKVYLVNILQEKLIEIK